MEARCAPGETIESLLRRFKKITQKGGVLAEAVPFAALAVHLDSCGRTVGCGVSHGISSSD